MQSSGWKPGTALGASSMPAHESTAAQVKITVKDNTLGLGASLKSRNVEHQRTGLDAFQGLLGRLNSKDAAELQKAEEKVENRKLAMFALGRWGGMVFVPGGLLVQEDPTKLKPKQENLVKTEDVEMADQVMESESDDDSDALQKPERKRKREGETPEERAQRKAEKRQRKEEKRARKEAKQLKKLQSKSGVSTPSTDVETSGTSTGTSTTSILRSGTSTPIRPETMKNGRHLLRGRNIQAKRAAFSDAKGLDQIFMRQQQTA